MKGDIKVFLKLQEHYPPKIGILMKKKLSEK
jgi:hypothetical protein